MATNVFFNNFKNFGEQRLYEDLIVEHIKIYGDDMYYIPRVLNNLDPVYDQDDMSSYEKAYVLELFLQNFDGFQGDGNFMSKFGLQIDDTITLTVARKRWQEEVGDVENQPRPNEGDLIFFPLNEKCFQITFVDNKPFFYPFGELFTYTLTCKLFQYSGEVFDTGIPEIDRIANAKKDQFDWAILDDQGNAILATDGTPILASEYDEDLLPVDPIDDNDDLQSEAEDIIDWSVADPFSESGNY